MTKTKVKDQHFIIWNSIRLISHALTRLRNVELAEYGITNQQAAMLWMINRLGPKATPTEIARRLLREPASISNILTRMEKLGHVRRIQDIKRYNQVRFVLTQKGKGKFQDSLKRETMHRVISQLTKHRREELLLALLEMRKIVLHELDIPEADQVLMNPISE